MCNLIKKVFIEFKFLCSFFVGLGVASPTCSGSVTDSVSDAVSGFFVENTLPLKLLRSFSLALIINPAFFKKIFFQLVFLLYPYPLIHEVTGFVFHQHLPMTNFLRLYLLEKLGQEHLLKL